MATSINVEHLSKRYRINHQQQDGRSLWRKIGYAVATPLRGVMQGAAIGSVEEFWAVRDVSFSVNPGEVLGIVGRNGAGKSTLLKILTRITEPTSGNASIRGRVGSLLEVGTGFHPELTGRDNVYLNASILGMSRREIKSKFDEIVEFSGVEKFLDTPVKRYSSGMKVRLAFAVAAHLDLEILLIDEVLAVGDADFQKRCIGKMDDVARAGRTILFVSHNMVAVRSLCQRVISMKDGQITNDGECAAVINEYLAENTSAAAAPEMDLRQWPRKGTGEAQFVEARLVDNNGHCSGEFTRLGPMNVEFTIESQSEANLTLSAVCMTRDDTIKVLQLDHHDTPGFEPGVIRGRRTVRFAVDSLPLQCGEYQWVLGIHSATTQNTIDLVYDVLPFVVEDDMRTSTRPYRSVMANGLCSLPADWSFVDSR